MRLVFVGADHEVTGSCHFIQTGDKNLLVDCGMEQGKNVFENAPLPVSAEKIDYVFLTHAHIDHSGLLPKLYAEGFRGEIITTHATRMLCDIMLRDSAHIQVQEAQYRSQKAEKRGTGEKYDPLYTMEDAMNVMRQFAEYRYDTVYDLCEGIRFRLTDIGHLLGSASIELWLTENGQERKIVFSGDIGNEKQPLLRDPQMTEEADFVVMESTYGDRFHEQVKGNYVEQLAGFISDTMERGGNLVIPSFAVGRTQVLLYFIRQIKEQNLVPEYPDFPVYVDSPMAVEAISVFHDSEYECYDEEAAALLAKGKNPISFPNLRLCISTEESIAINDDQEPKIIISASGMCDAGRIRHHLKHNISDPRSTVMFVGYQAVGTLGRHIMDGAEKIKLFGTDYLVRAKIVQMEGMSGHADKNGLLHWIESFKQKPEQVFVVHGDDEVAASFAQCLSEEHGFKADAPFSGTEYDLIEKKFIKITEGIPIVKEAPAEGGAAQEQKEKCPVSDAYTKLRIATKRLEGVIEQASGMAHKDLERFTKEINDLCRKYKITGV